MKKKLLIFLGLISGILVISWTAAAPTEKIKQGDFVPPLILRNIHESVLVIPDQKSRYVHLQFRRFAGCPICNLHLHSFVERASEIAAAGIHEVVIYHSPRESLLPYQGKFPFDVIADPEKKLYAEFGVGSSIFSLLDVRAWPAIIKGNSLQDRPKGDPEGGPLGRPADFLIAPN